MTGSHARRAANIVTIFLVAHLFAGCGRQPETLASPPGPAPLAIRLDYLQSLGLDAVVRGRPVRVVALYAEAPDDRPTGSPARDGHEGIASLDDAARAAVVYLRAYEATGDASARDEALGLLAFVVAMEQGDGEFVNFIDAQGRPNRDAASSRKSMSYWAARSIWALGEAVRVLGPRDPSELKTVRPALDRAVNRMAREIEAGRLIGGSATATAEALLGLLALQRAEPSPRITGLAERTAALLVPLSMGSMQTPPWGARVDRPGATWHAWGSRPTTALAEAAIVLNRPDFATAARREADALWGRFLLAGRVASAITSRCDLIVIVIRGRRIHRTGGGRRNGFRRSRMASGPSSRAISRWRTRRVNARTRFSRGWWRAGFSAPIPRASACTTKRRVGRSMGSMVLRRCG